jgi:hypothetical protein
MVLTNVPDSLSKLFLIAGVALVIYGYSQDTILVESYNNTLDQKFDVRDSIAVSAKNLDRKREKLIAYANNMSVRNEVENPMISNDSLVKIRNIIAGADKKIISIHDSIRKQFDAYLDESYFDELNKDKLATRLERLDKRLSVLESDIDYNKQQLYAGFALLIIGFVGFLLYKERQDSLQLRNRYEKPVYHKRCQSCSKIFDSMTKRGTEKTGTLSAAFCQDCYIDGDFVEPDLTQKEMIGRTKKNISNYKKIARFIILNRIKFLERWNGDRY